MRKMSVLAIVITLIVVVVPCVTVSQKNEDEGRNQTMDSDSINVGESVIQDIKIEVVYDNNPFKEGLAAAWGFSCLIRGTEKTILFDTGGDGSILLTNMDKLGINPMDIDLVVLSHVHLDHIGGLLSLLEKNEEIAVYMPRSLPDDFKKDVKAHGAEVVDVIEPVQICENVYSTGELGMQIKEQSLIIRTAKGLIIITGCAHPGVVQIVEKVKDLFKDNVLMVMGGFHLISESEEKIKSIISSFQKLKVLYVAPCHCSGDAARELFKKAYRDNFIDVGVGKLIAVGDLS